MVDEYNGDITRFGGSFYRGDEGNRLVVAVILLLTLGFTGAHRFYLGEMRHGMVHLGFLFVAFFAVMRFAFEFAVTVLVIQAVVLLIELVFFFVRAAMGR